MINSDIAWQVLSMKVVLETLVLLDMVSVIYFLQCVTPSGVLFFGKWIKVEILGVLGCSRGEGVIVINV